ncbi:rogdi-like protein [Labeo rohita]|uniref:Protein rogdi homolog n=1 Tax=Labeo rohita TaxID=84645 RepID=A0A498NI50_LABRO|nr:rogdi-like protein [Labeo rohita]
MLGTERSTLSELAKMTAASQAERTVLEEEFNWLLKEEVHAVLKQLQDILKEASRRFSMPSPGLEGQLKQENFILGSSTMDQVKGVLTLQGEALTQAIQDARNHVNQALQLLSSRDESYHFKTGAEVNKLMDAVMLQLTRARNRLTTPASMTLPELAASGLMKMFTPPMPGDVMVNFYINLSKLCLTVYQLHVLQPNTTKNFKSAGSSVLHNPGAMFEYNNTKFEVSHVHKVECVVPWLNDTLVFFTISLQLCQQLKDKCVLRQR